MSVCICSQVKLIKNVSEKCSLCPIAYSQYGKLVFQGGGTSSGKTLNSEQDTSEYYNFFIFLCLKKKKALRFSGFPFLMC